MNPRELDGHPGWAACTFRGARRDTLLRSAKMTFREKLEWLEESETLALRLQASRVRVRETPVHPPRSEGGAKNQHPPS